MELVDIAVGGGQQRLPPGLGDPGHVGCKERLVKPAHGLLLAQLLLVNRLEGTTSRVRRDPLRTDGDQVFMQPRGLVTIEAESSQQVNERQRAFRLGQAGTGEIVVNKTLRLEPGQQATADPVFQMHVHGFHR